MYSDVVRSGGYKRKLLDFFQQEYGIEATGISPAKRGFYGETWRLDAANNSYFLKLVYATAHQAVYARSFPIIQHLCGHGIGFINQIIKTKDGRLSAQFDGAVLGAFDWIDGENIETDATKFPEYQMLAKVYSVPVHGVAIPIEDFSGRSANKFFEQWNALEDEQVLSLLENNRAIFEYRAKRLKTLARQCQGDAVDFFITHGDAGGNYIVNGDRRFIVDWDDPMLAPPERDAWVMCGKDWAREAFEAALRRNGITYTLRPERLAYYCYRFFFFYLTEFLKAFTQADTIEEYLEGWIKESLAYADEFQIN